MKTNSVEIGSSVTGNDATNDIALQRFVVFVAGGKRPITSVENFAQAERLALIFAGITNVRMEVFDDDKGICYFVEPSEAKGSLVL